MKTDLTIKLTLPIPPERLYHDWLDSQAHSAFTGSPAHIQPQVGGEFSAWDGYIQGRTLEAESNRRILQSWRSADFPDGVPDSLVEVLFDARNDGTLLTIHHSRIPSGQADEYEQGWQDYYFKPMRAYYSWLKKNQ
jgi:activator of HSP90 ATPase